MATGVSTHRGSLCCRSSSSCMWFSSSLGRSVAVSPWSSLRPLSCTRRLGFCSLQRSGANSSDIGTWDHSYLNSVLHYRRMEQDWVDEKNRVKLSRVANQVINDIVCGRIVVNNSEQAQSMEKGSMESRASQDEHVYRSTNLYPGENIGRRLAFQPSKYVGKLLPQPANGRRTDLDLEDSHLLDKTAHADSSMTSGVSIGMDNGAQMEMPPDALAVPLFDIVKAKPEDAIIRYSHSDGTSSTDRCIQNIVGQPKSTKKPQESREKLAHIFDKVLVVDNILAAKEVVQMLTTKYRSFIHACDTEVAKIDVKQDTPVGHGEVICFSIYSCKSGSEADFGNGKSCIWVDVLDGGQNVLMEFAPFFEDPAIKKVWHNYSFDSHIIENYGLKLSGFHADTMHLARLWDSSRRADGGYSLEALTSDSVVMSDAQTGLNDGLNVGKISMKSIFGKKKVKKDGSEGKIITIPPVEELQREERNLWICYSALDSISTLRLFESLKRKLEGMLWTLDGYPKGTMYDFYEEYWRPFGFLLTKMETAGMLVDRSYLSQIEKIAIAEQQLAADLFRKWASKYCADAKYMNVGSDAQIRQLFFGGIQNRKDPNETLPSSKIFKVPNDENVIEEGKKSPSKYRTITLCNLGVDIQTEIYTASGWPSVSGDALKTLAGKISTDQIYTMEDECGSEYDSSSECEHNSLGDEEEETPDKIIDVQDTPSYGTAYDAFGRGKAGKEACHAIAALCEVCSIDSLISNFILPLQGDHISCNDGRIHCSLNINTETGRLSARRPNLQNQPALEKDRYKIRQAFIAEPGNSLIVADYGQLELRILAHLANCKSMLDAFKAGGDFHSRTAMNMYKYIREAVEEKRVLLEWHPQPGEEKPPVPLLKDAFAAERRKAKMLNFSIAYGKTPVGLSRDWKVSVKEAKETVKLWYKERKEVLRWQEERKKQAQNEHCVYTLLGRSRRFPSIVNASPGQRGHIERAAINTPVQGSAADVAMCAMLEIERNPHLKRLGWRLLLQVHDEVILEGPTESAELAKSIVVECMSKPFYGTNFLKVDLAVDAKCEQSWYAAK
ncbi:DNA polymerase I A, chloroplastic-like [Typha latifolia]|uniref:DNA polymerase I A, chloroplastic-like n=1 Tax=Typha latifolia TaxID=4733 RepID=UPI003C2D1071